MWPIVLGVAGLAIALYELWTRPTVAELASAASSAPKAGEPPRLDVAKARACELQPHDWVDADRWSAERLGPTLPVRERLEYIRSMYPPAMWPASARRMYCYLIGPLPLVPGPVKPVKFDSPSGYGK